MAIKKNAARQELIVAHLDIGFADPTTYGTAEEAFDLPGNAILLGGDVVVKTPWNSATTATLKLGDAADDDRYTASAIDLKTAGRTALTLTGYKHTTAQALKALIAQMLVTNVQPTCPHGRPIVSEWTRRELDKRFKRIQ